MADKELPAGVSIMPPDDEEDAVVSDDPTAFSDSDLMGMIDEAKAPAPEPEIVEPKATEIVVESDDVKEDEAPKDAEKDEPTLPSEIELLKMQMDLLKSQAEHWRVSHDRLSGEYGRLKKDFESRRRSATTDEFDQSAAPQDAGLEEIREKMARIEDFEKRRRQEEANRAVAEETARFGSTYPTVNALKDEMAASLSKRGDEIQRVLDSDDPDDVRRSVRIILADSYAEAVSMRASAARSAPRVEELKNKKRATAVPSSTVTRRATQPKTVDDLKTEELRSLIDGVPVRRE